MKLVLRAINTYRDEEATEPLVVCSRLLDYEALQAQLKLGLAIVLKPLSEGQVKRYFARLQARQTQHPPSGPLTHLCEQIWHDEALRALTDTPLMLNIITVTYAHPQAEPLPQSTGDDLRAQIFNAYTDRMFNRVGRKIILLYSPDTTLRYLRYLAVQLQAHGLTQFSIGQIRRSWLLAGKIRTRYRWLSGLLVGLLVGLFVVLISGLTDGLPVGLFFALLAGLVFGLVEVEPAESLRWRWETALKWLSAGILGGLLGGGVCALLAENGFVILICLGVGLLGSLFFRAES